MKQKRIEQTHAVLTANYNALQAMAHDIEDRIDMSELPAYPASVLADKLIICMRDMEQLQRDFKLAIEQGDLL